ncbi:M28 family metallopeptidase [Candidatus Margulisiibacteriota bacterium]
MNNQQFIDSINTHLNELCVNIPHRHVGSAGNQKATDYFKQAAESLGFKTEVQSFDCIDWESGPVTLTAGGNTFEAFVSPYSLPCDISAPLTRISSIPELENADIRGKIVLLHKEIAKEQIMPKSFVFYNPAEHKKIVSLLEAKQPLAIIAATTRNPELAGALYPFPLFEDGDFDIPSVFMTDEESVHLLNYLEDTVTLQFDSKRIPSTGCNIAAAKGPENAKKVVFCAHIDTKKDTPGALDNGSGIVMLLTLGELLKEYSGSLNIELLAVNGEDYYSAPGQTLYLKKNTASLSHILLAVNTDGAAYGQDRTTYCCFECSEELVHTVKKVFADKSHFTETDPWYQGDHMVFAMSGVPAIALTSESFEELSANIAHTEKDTIDKVNPETILIIAEALKELIGKFKI